MRNIAPEHNSRQNRFTEEILNHRFELARKWVECFYQTFGDDFHLPSEQLQCEAMEIIDLLSEDQQVREASSGNIRITRMLGEVGASHCHELILEIGGDEEVEVEFLDRCSCFY